MNTPASKDIMERFYRSLDAIIMRGEIRGVNTYCRLYGIDRRNLQANRKNLDRGWFQVGWLYPLVANYGISATWLLTGEGEMFGV